jgi:hypothetical protein
MTSLKEVFAPAWQKEVWKAVNIPDLAHRVSAPFNDPRLLLALSRLGMSLGPHLTHYDTILGDDASGRVPALLVGRWARQKRQESGRKTPNLYFIHPVPGYSHHYTEFEAFLKKHKGAINHVLFVTEYIKSGAHAGNIVEILSEHNIKSDVATVSLIDDPSTYSLGEYLFYGDISEETGHRAFHRNAGVSGVYTNSMLTGATVCRRGPAFFENVQRARQDAALVADSLYPLVV